MTSLKPLSIALFLSSATLLASGCSSNSVTPSDPVAHSAPTAPSAPKLIPEPETPMLSESLPEDSSSSEADLIANQEVEATESNAQTHIDTDVKDAAEVSEGSMTLALQDTDDTLNNEPDTPSDRPDTTLFKFGFDKQELDNESVTKIEKHAEFLMQHPDLRITINGHADSQGDATYNEQLSLKRARYVASILKEKGVKQEQIEIFSWGAADPVADAKHPRDNRRVELIYGDEYLAKTAF